LSFHRQQSNGKRKRLEDEEFDEKEADASPMQIISVSGSCRLMWRRLCTVVCAILMLLVLEVLDMYLFKNICHASIFNGGKSEKVGRM